MGTASHRDQEMIRDYIQAMNRARRHNEEQDTFLPAVCTLDQLDFSGSCETNLKFKTAKLNGEFSANDLLKIAMSIK